MVSAFDDIQRQGDEPASHLIGRFYYLNSSGREEAALVREKVDEFLNNYPAEHQATMIRGLRSRDDIRHRSSFFELALHELLLRQGHRVVEVEPELPGGRRPDFLVEA